MLTKLIDQALVDNRELKIPAQDVQIASNEIPEGERRTFTRSKEPSKSPLEQA